MTWVQTGDHYPKPVLLNSQPSKLYWLDPTDNSWNITTWWLFGPGHQANFIHIMKIPSGTQDTVSHIPWRDTQSSLKVHGCQVWLIQSKSPMNFPASEHLITDRLCWCLIPELCFIRTHFYQSTPSLMVWLVHWRHLHVTVSVSNLTGLLSAGARIPRKGRIYGAHPTCCFPSLNTSGLAKSG